VWSAVLELRPRAGNPILGRARNKHFARSYQRRSCAAVCTAMPATSPRNELAVSCVKSGAGLQPEFVHRVSGAGHPGRPFARGPCRRANAARRGWFLEKAAMERQVTVKFGHTRSKRFQKALSEAGNGPGECGRARVGQDYRVSSPVARRRRYTPSSPPARTGSPLRATHVPAKLTVAC
jgi:hypothetical protein